MDHKGLNRLVFLLVVIAIMVSNSGGAQTAFKPEIPVTYQPAISTQQTITLPSLEAFITALSSPDETGIRGIYAQNTMALRVVQQPLNDPGFVSGIDGVATLFRQAALFNNIGLLAHNYAAGRYFAELKDGDQLQIIYGDGSFQTYSVTAIYRFEALDPENPTSSFVDLQTNETLNAMQLFKKVYWGNHHITLQTCIQQGEDPSWGRLFIIAEPI